MGQHHALNDCFPTYLIFPPEANKVRTAYAT